MVNRFNRLARPVWVLLAILAFLTVSTVALAHGHPDARSVDESHCAMCLAIHSATHVVVTPVLTLHFTAVQNRFLVPSTSFLLALNWLTLNQDRAPPSSDRSA